MKGVFYKKRIGIFLIQAIASKQIFIDVIKRIIETSGVQLVIVNSLDGGLPSDIEIESFIKQNILFKMFQGRIILQPRDFLKYLQIEKHAPVPGDVFYLCKKSVNLKKLISETKEGYVDIMEEMDKFNKNTFKNKGIFSELFLRGVKAYIAGLPTEGGFVIEKISDRAKAT
jgi:hypothetical protein